MTQLYSTISTFYSTHISSTVNNSSVTVRREDVSIYRNIPSLFWLFLSVETLLIIFANSMLCWLFINNRKLRSQQNYFVLSLSISDLLVGLTVAPCEYCALKHPQYQGADCPLFCGSVISFNMLASTINLVLIAADRYCSIKKPFRYQEVLSRRRVVTIILMGWFLTLLMTMIPMSWALNPTETAFKVNLYFTLTVFALVLLVGIGLAVVYYTIVKIIRDKLRTTKERSSNPAGIKVCILVAISFFICWIPTCIVEVLLQLNVGMPSFIFNASYFILLLNPCLDPLMYAYYRHDFRRELATWSRRQWKRLKSMYDIIVQKSDRNKRDVYKSNDRYNNNFKTLLKPNNHSNVQTLLKPNNHGNVAMNSVVIDRNNIDCLHVSDKISVM